MVILLKAFELAQAAGLRVNVTDSTTGWGEGLKEYPIYCEGENPLLVFYATTLDSVGYGVRSILWAVAKKQGKDLRSIDMEFDQMLTDARQIISVGGRANV